MQCFLVEIINLIFFFLKNRLISLKKLKTSLQADVEKYKAYMSNLESHSSILDQKLSGLDEEIGRLGKQR